MLDERSAVGLIDVMRRESRSLLCYMADAQPWASTGQGPALEAIRESSSAVTDGVSRLGRYLLKQRVAPPMMGAYPAYFSSCNFLAVSWLLPRLVESEKALLEMLEADIKALPSAEARQELAALAATKKAAISRLEAQAGPAAAA